MKTLYDLNWLCSKFYLHILNFRISFVIGTPQFSFSIWLADVVKNDTQEKNSRWALKSNSDIWLTIQNRDILLNLSIVNHS